MESLADEDHETKDTHEALSGMGSFAYGDHEAKDTHEALLMELRTSENIEHGL